MMKKVILIIYVPDGEYCYGIDLMELCSFFDNENGCISCDVGFNGLKITSNNVVKSPQCSELRDIKQFFVDRNK